MSYQYEREAEHAYGCYPTIGEEQVYKDIAYFMDKIGADEDAGERDVYDSLSAVLDAAGVSPDISNGLAHAYADLMVATQRMAYHYGFEDCAKLHDKEYMSEMASL